MVKKYSNLVVSLSNRPIDSVLFLKNPSFVKVVSLLKLYSFVLDKKIACFMGH